MKRKKKKKKGKVQNMKNDGMKIKKESCKKGNKKKTFKNEPVFVAGSARGSIPSWR